ncbi:MAG: putative Ig domain-containing protein, partial [Candidatus Pacearchaeota archaeon]
YVGEGNLSANNNRFFDIIYGYVIANSSSSLTINQLNVLPNSRNNLISTNQFSNEATRDFSLVQDSEWINSGKSSGVLLPSFDYYGNPRIYGAEIDIGPIEYNVSAQTEICNNAIDDDGDGLIDCADVLNCAEGTSCGAGKTCQFEICELVIRNQPPILDSIGPKTVNENTLLQFTLTYSDPDGNAITCSASNLPTGATFNQQTCTFSWTPGFDKSEVYSNILFTIVDNGNPIESDSEEITITVGNVPYTCIELGGDVCLSDEYCSSSEISSPDTDRCCDTTCSFGEPSWSLCSDCGGGLFDLDICDETECNLISESCYFVNKIFPIPNTCTACSATFCSDYVNQVDCNTNRCGINNCVWNLGTNVCEINSPMTSSGGDLYLNGGKWEGYGVMHITQLYQDINLDPFKNDFLFSDLWPKYGVTNENYPEKLNEIESNPVLKEQFLNEYNSVFEDRFSRIEEELFHIKELGFNVVAFQGTDGWNEKHFLPMSQINSVERRNLNYYSCDTLKRYLKLLDKYDLKAVINPKPGSSTTMDCDPFAFVEKGSGTYMGELNGMGCVDFIKDCVDPETESVILAWDLGWESLLFFHPNGQPSLILQFYDWIYYTEKNGRAIEGVNYDEYKGTYYNYLGGEWENWLINNYGSVEEAEKQLRKSRIVEMVKNPEIFSSQSEFCSEENSPLTSAVRKFSNYQSTKKYQEAIDKIKVVDSRHLFTGHLLSSINNGFCNNLFLPDSRYVLKYTDIAPVEIYPVNDFYFPDTTEGTKYPFDSTMDKRIESIVGVTLNYASRNGLKPIDLPEYGYGISENPTSEEILQQDSVTKSVYKSIIKYGVDLSIHWIYSSSYLGGEVNGQHGLFSIVDYNSKNPSGSHTIDRLPLANTIKSFSESGKNKPSNQITNYIVVDSDAKANLQSEFLRGIQEAYGILDANSNAVIGVKTSCSEVTSSSLPGNILCSGNQLNIGNCPLKCFDSILRKIEVKNSSGEWTEIKQTKYVVVRFGEPVQIRATIDNYGESLWKSSNVYLTEITTNSMIKISKDISFESESEVLELNLPAISDSISAKLRMKIQYIGGFGEEVDFIIVPEEKSTFCQSNYFYSSPTSVSGQSCCFEGKSIPSNSIAPGENRFLCYNGRIYVHDGDVISLPNFVRVSSSCSIVGNYYANSNYPWTATNQEWMGGWKLGIGEGLECRENMVCKQSACVNEIRNLISNGDFLNALNSWVPNDIAKVSVTASDFNLNSQSMKISGYGFAIQKPVNLINKAGKKYSISFWLKKDSGMISRISVVSEDWQTSLIYKEIRDEINGWRKYEFKFTIPDNKRYQVILDSYNTNTGNVWYDDVRLVEIS